MEFSFSSLVLFSGFVVKGRGLVVRFGFVRGVG